MQFSEISKKVDDKLKTISLEEKINVFNEVLKFPISYKDGVYVYLGENCDEVKMRDFIEISQHWLSVKEYDKLHQHFKL